MFLIAKGYIGMTADEYPVLKLSHTASAVLKGHEKIVMKQTRLVVKDKKKTKKTQNPGTSHPKLYDELVKIRAQIAQEKHVPLYVVFSNAVLTDLASVQPTTKEAFLNIKGIGEKKYETYGDAFMTAIKTYKKTF